MEKEEKSASSDEESDEEDSGSNEETESDSDNSDSSDEVSCSSALLCPSATPSYLSNPPAISSEGILFLKASGSFPGAGSIGMWSRQRLAAPG